MKKTSIAGAMILAAIAVSAAHAQSESFKVNGVTIPASRVEFLMKQMAAQGRPDTPEVRNAVKEQLITGELLAQEARKKGLDKNQEVSTQIELTRQEVLANAYVQDYVKAHPVTDDALKKEYERIKSQLGTKEYRARHILVETEDEAKDVIAQIKKGGSFEKLAAEKSKDTGSKANGGDLDWSAPSRYVKPFADALVKLKKGQMTDAPVQTNFGWHVIQVQDERALKVPTFDEAKANLQRGMQQQTVQKAVADLRAKAKIE